MTIRTTKPTIYDIARLSGASPSTVSAALSGKGPSRRIAAATVEEIQKIAADLGYSTNMQARGLRQARSHLVGMIIPEHDNRYFSALSRSFEAEARARGLCPVIVSTLRDPEEEIRTLETLVSYQVDFMLIAGASDPAAISRLCDAARKPHVFVDLPGRGRQSVITDNHLGAVRLTDAILDGMPAPDGTRRGRLYLLGGDARDYATKRRVEGFREAVEARHGICEDDQIIICGYTPGKARDAAERLLDRLGGLPAGLFVNSLTAFEGVLGLFVKLPADAFSRTSIGCYDYDPFAAYLQFPVYMVRQDSDRLVEQAFAMIEGGAGPEALVEIPPALVPPRTIYRDPRR